MGRRWWARPGLGWAGPVGPAQPIKLYFGGPRPGPARQIFRGWAAARPDPSIFQRMGRGPA